MSSRRKLIKDLTRTRHMTLVSAVVLGTTFMPLLGIPELYEVRALQHAVDSLSVLSAPRRDDEAARERSALVVGSDRNDRRERARAGDIERLPTVSRDEVEPLEAIDVPEAEPLPELSDTELVEPSAGDMPAPEVEEPAPEMLEEPDSPTEDEVEPAEEEEPADEAF
jgi:hypothetical protein